MDEFFHRITKMMMDELYILNTFFMYIV